MQMYSTIVPQSLYYVEALLNVQEVELDKFRKKLTVLFISANVVHVNHQTTSVHYNFSGNQGHGRTQHGRGYSSSGNRTTCQLYGKYDHVLVNYWYRFDGHFTPTQARANAS